MDKHGALDPTAIAPLAAIDVLNSTINTRVDSHDCTLRKLYIGYISIMFRHMPVPRDTSVSRQIIIVCCESVGNCQTDLRNLCIVSISSFFSVLCVRCPLFLTNFVPIRCVPTTCFAHCFHVYQ